MYKMHVINHFEIWNVDSRLVNEIFWCSLFTWSRELILTFWWRYDDRDLTIKILLFGFHRDHWSHQGEDLAVNPISLHYKFSLFDVIKHSWIVTIGWTFWIAHSLNLLVSSSSRLIFASIECLKLWFPRNNRENSLLELLISIFKNVKWKALIRGL